MFLPEHLEKLRCIDRCTGKHRPGRVFVLIRNIYVCILCGVRDAFRCLYPASLLISGYKSRRLAKFAKHYARSLHAFAPQIVSSLTIVSRGPLCM